MHPTRRQCRALLLEATVVLSTTGCMGWHREPDGLSAALKGQPSTIRVTGADSSQRVIAAPAQVGDTLVGRDSVIRIPTAAIARVETRGADYPKTLALLGGVGLALLIGAVAAQDAIENQLWH